MKNKKGIKISPIIIGLDEEKKDNPWGYHLILNLYDCDQFSIQSERQIKKFINDLCNFIGMRKFSDAIIQYFGDTEAVAGFSVFQFIETSSITGHFVSSSKAAYLDVFSCKSFDMVAASNFSAKYFGSKKFVWREIYRV